QAYYQESLRVKPSFAPAYYQLSKIAIQNQHLDSAQKLLEKALTLSPDNPEVYYLLATVQYHRKQAAEKTLKHLDQALKLNPGYTDALSMRGIIHYERATYPQAVSDFEKALSLALQRADLHRNLAVA